MNKYAVWGNPIKQSLSPQIYQYFAKQVHTQIEYSRIETSKKQFKQQILDFFHIQKAKGANITAPFKELAFDIADIHSKYSLITNSCNTLIMLEGGKIMADNTDGIGFISDLTRLGWKQENQSILILGAGGATRGVLYPLLKQNNSIAIYNRTFEKAVRLAQDFSKFGKVNVVTYDDLNKTNTNSFDLIVNATSAGLSKKYIPIQSHLLEGTYIYDMQYSANMNTPFLSYANQYNIKSYQDGLGMLVAQAAYSFHKWEKIMPQIEPVLQQLRVEIDS